VEFKRVNPAGRTFSGGGFKLTRPSGPKLTRDGLGFKAKDRDYDVRRDGDQIWLMDGDRLVGYANGNSGDWHLLIDDEPFGVEQEKAGTNVSALKRDDHQVGEIRGSGFPLRAVAIDSETYLDDEKQAFIVMIALLGWRESDRSLFSSIQTPDGGSGGAP
jgi:hypothetical protein